MRRTVRGLATAVIVLLLATRFTANAQPRGKVYRMGYIQTATPDEQEHLTKALDEGLRELGYVVPLIRDVRCADRQGAGRR